MCVCVCLWVCLALWAGEQSSEKTPLQYQLKSPAHSTRFCRPGLLTLYCSQHMSRENINISKPSTDNSLPLYVSLFSYCPLCHILSLLFSLSQSLPCLSLTLQPSLSVSPAGKTSLSWREGWQQWSGCKSHWLLVLDLVDGERANVIVQALVTVDTGSSEGWVI